MNYEIIFSREAKKNISELDHGYKTKLKIILKNLSEHPFSYPYKKLKGKENTYRIRLGKYRIIYYVDSLIEKL